VFVQIISVTQWVLLIKLFILSNPDNTNIKTSFLITGLPTASNSQTEMINYIFLKQNLETT